MNGFYNILKPCGMTSSDVVVKLRGILRSKTSVKHKVGHLGTLDPLASGVLGVAVGSATKLFDYFLSKTKTYIATLRLGSTTDTLDDGGVLLEKVHFAPVTCEQLSGIFNAFIPTYSQMPPQYSAKSVNGVRAYNVARSGGKVELSSKTVNIFSLELLKQLNNTDYQIKIVCGGGTYIRSLCRDIGVKLGLPAYMAALSRVQNGFMQIDDAVCLDEVERDAFCGFTSLEKFALNFEKVTFPESERLHLDNGMKMQCDVNDCDMCGLYIDDKFYGVAEVKDGCLSVIARG